jgi:type 1 glutamine amidotransferase
MAGVLALAVSAACGVVLAGQAAKPAAKSKILMMVGGPFHDNPQLYPILQNALEKTGDFTMTISRDLDQFKAANIANYDLVLIYCTHLTLTKEQEDGLVGFVKGGKGLVGIHCATDTFRDSDAYWKLVGGRFRSHGNETFKVNITGKSHPIVKGMSDFEISDETYCDDFHPDSKVIVLMRRDKDGEPAAWVQYYGKGRVFVTGLGHGKSAWENPAFQELIKRAAEWATFRLNP